MKDKKILLIDDEKNILLMIKNRLRAHGFDVITASSGSEGLEKARKEAPDLIVLDVLMPDMDGKEVCRLLKSESSTAKTPIIFLTCKDTIEDKMAEYQAGGECHITKPFDAVEMVEKIERTLTNIKDFEQNEE